MMIMLTVIAILTGAVLGLRFTVLILVPASFIGSVATFGIGIAHSNGLWSILLALVLVISALQIGYFSGAVIRFVNAGVRFRKYSSGILTPIQRAGR